MLFIEPIYQFKGFGLGDKWASWNYAVKKSLNEKRNINIYHLIKSEEQTQCISGDNYDLFKKISSLLEYEGKISITINKKRIISLGDLYHYPYLKTKKQWQNNNNKVITYAFDGQHTMDRKRCSPEDQEKILNYLSKKGYHLVDVGNHKPLEWIVDQLSQAEWHLGLDSGISHIAQSVGTPINIIFNRLNLYEIVKVIYPHKPVNLFCLVDNFIQALNNGFNPKNQIFYLDPNSVYIYIKLQIYKNYYDNLKEHLLSFIDLPSNRKEIYYKLDKVLK